MTRLQRIVAGGAALLLALSLGVLIGRLGANDGPDRGARGDLPPTGEGTADPDRDRDDGDVIVDDTPVPPPLEGHALRLSARARSFETDARLPQARTIRLANSLGLRILADLRIRDGNGRRTRASSLTVEGRSIRLRGRLTLDVETWRWKDGEITFRPDAFARVATEGRLEIRSGSVRDQDRRRIETPVTILDPATRLNFEHDPSRDRIVRWTDPPARLVLEHSERTAASWYGSGSIVTASRSYADRFLGFTGSSVHIDAVRRADQLHLTGTAEVTQVYAAGRPRLRTRARVEFPLSNAVTVRAGERGSFTWAPRNLGDVDLCITRISARSRAGRWVNTRLLPLPPMFGGESRRPVGGDTDTLDPDFGFLGGAVPLASVIQAMHADSRDITFDVPEGTDPGRRTIVLRLEGNFDPIEARIRVTVRRPRKS